MQLISFGGMDNQFSQTLIHHYACCKDPGPLVAPPLDDIMACIW